MHRLRTARGNDGANDYQFREAEIRLAQFRASHDAALEEKAQAMYQCDLAQARVEEHIIRAPFAGRVVRVNAQAGATLTTSDDLLTIVALDRLDAELHLPVTYYDRLRIGATYPLIASAPVGGVLHGRLRTAEPMIDPAPIRRVLARCAISVPKSKVHSSPASARPKASPLRSTRSTPESRPPCQAAPSSSGVTKTGEK